MTGGSARQQAGGSARDAVVAALAPICAERFRRPGRRRGAGCGARQVEFMGARRDRRKEPVCTHARQQDDRFRRGTRLRRDAGDSSSYQKLTLLRTERPRRPAPPLNGYPALWGWPPFGGRCSEAFPSQIRGRQSLFPDLGFPVRNLPASARKARKIDLGVGSCGLGHLRFDGIPCYFPCYGQRRRRIVRGRLRPPAGSHARTGSGSFSA